MKLSLRAEYALRALISLAASYQAGVVSIQTLSDAPQIPKRFLEQILNDLRSGGFVESKRGISGGYRLARAADEITVSDILQYVEGSFGQGADSGKRAPIPSDMDAAQFAIRGLMREAGDAAVSVLKDVTIEDLRSRAEAARSAARLTADYMI